MLLRPLIDGFNGELWGGVGSIPTQGGYRLVFVPQMILVMSIAPNPIELTVLLPPPRCRRGGECFAASRRRK